MSRFDEGIYPKDYEAGISKNPNFTHVAYIYRINLKSAFIIRIRYVYLGFRTLHIPSYSSK